MQRKSDRFHKSPPIRWLALFSHLAGPGSYWPKVRAAQLSALRRTAITRLALILSAIGAITYFRPGPRPSALLGWVALATLSGLWWSLGLVFLAQKSRHGTRRLLHREARVALFNGVVWAALPLLFGPALLASGLTQEALVGLALLCLAVTAGIALTLSAAPIALLGFLVPAGSGVVAALVLQGFALSALTTSILLACLALQGLANGRTQMQFQTAEAALADKRDMVSLLLREQDDNGGGWIWQTDAGRSLVGVTPRLADALGHTVASLEGRSILQVLGGSAGGRAEIAPSVQELWDKLRQRDRFVGLVLPVEIAGETRWWQLSGAPQFDVDGGFAGFRGVGSDVTEAHRSIDRIGRMARFDPLTSLPNRAHLMETLESAMAAASASRGRCALLLIDLDRFKAVNDTMGHPMGDKLLAQVADRLRALASDNEMCGRLGGDEFAVVVRDANDPTQLQAFARQIVASLSQPYELDRSRLVIGASVGSAAFPRDGRTVETLMRAADLALYQSKHQGGGAVNAYQTRFEAEAEERRLLEIALQGALERQELALHYQPVWDRSCRAIIGFEALLRWTCGDRGTLVAEQFVPIARESRLIIPIGIWALRLACEDAADWPDGIGVSLNVAGEQLADAGLVTSVMQALSQSRLHPHRLTIDVGEEALRIAGSAGLLVLDQLQALGVRLSLGEFGTGASALGHLSQSRFAGVKIHPGLIRDAAQGSRESAARIRAITTLADSLGLSATVVGIETEAQMRMACDLGASQLQGFLLGVPGPVQSVPALLASPPTPRAVA